MTGPNIFFQTEPDFELLHNLRKEFLSVSHDQSLLLVELVVFLSLLYKGYKLSAFLVTVVQLLFICAFLFFALLVYFDSIDLAALYPKIVDVATLAFAYISNIELFPFIQKFVDLGQTSLLVLNAHVFVLYELVLQQASLCMKSISDNLSKINIRLLLKHFLNAVADCLKRLADSL